MCHNVKETLLHTHRMHLNARSHHLECFGQLYSKQYSGPLESKIISGSNGKESACNARDLGLTHGWGRSPGERNDYPLQYSCLKNSMDRGV